MEEYIQVPEDSVFFDLTPAETTLLFYVLGLAAARSLTIDEINVLANGLFEMAQVMFVISAQRTLINDAIKAQQDKKETEKAEEEKKSAEKLAADVKKLQKQIQQLQKQIEELKK